MKAIWAGVMLLVAALMPTCAAVSHASESTTSRSALTQPFLPLPSIPGKPISLDCEASGVHLDLISTSFFMLHVPPQRYTRIRVTRGGEPTIDRRGTPPWRSFTGGRWSLLTDMSQLRGLVHVADEQAALRLVRLRTSPATLYAWGGERLEVEIVSKTQARGLPDYGLQSRMLAAIPQMPSGRRGILSDPVYATTSFEPARVTRVDGGFEVKRWIFWTSGRIGDTAAPPKWGVEQIREFVGEDGEYRRSTIAEIGVDGTLCLEIPFSFR